MLPIGLLPNPETRSRNEYSYKYRISALILADTGVQELPGRILEQNL